MKLHIAIFILLLATTSSLKAKNLSSPKSLNFLENKGQVKDQYQNQRTDIDFKISSGALNVFIGNGELHYQFHKLGTTDSNTSMYRMDVVLLNANKNARPITQDKQPYYERHYTSGNLAPSYSYSKITYKDIYPSIDWILYIKDNQLEYDFLIHKGGNPADIKLQYNGATSLAINNDGSLTASTPMGTITEAAPYSYQENGAKITSSFVLETNSISFKIAAYKGELTIDPKLEWSTYYGGSSTDYGSAVACDDSGYVYLAGGTGSFNNIATVGSHQITFNGMNDACLSKFNTQGEQLWATYYGGTETEHDIALAADKFHHVFLSGSTKSTTNISSPGSHQENLYGINDNAFLAKFNSMGERIWATYYGGDSLEHGEAVTCDDSGNVYLTGVTNSSINIATPGTHQDTYAGSGMFFTSGDAFLVKFDSTGIRQWGTYYGSTDMDWGFSVITDAACNVYISGQTSGTDVFATAGAHQEIQGGLHDAFIAKFNNSGQRIWGTFYGGSDDENGLSLALHENHLYLFDYTASTNNIATPGSFQPFFGGWSDMYLVKFDTSGVREWSTYFGTAAGEETQTDNGNKVFCDNTGNIYTTFVAVNHVTSIASGDGPQNNYGGGQFDIVLAKFNTSGIREWSTYYGTCDRERSGACAPDNNGNIYICGLLESEHMATPGSYQPIKDGLWDSYLAKFNEDQFGITGDTSVCAGSTVTYYASHVPGAESYTWILPNGWTGTSIVDTINVTVDNTSGTISVVANKSCSTEPPQELFITVHPLPAPVITLSGNTLSVSPAYVSYQWYNTAGAIPGATAQTYTLSGPDDYYVVVTDTNGCSGQSNTIALSVNEFSTSNSTLLYPNPNNGNFTLSITGLSGNEEVSIEITDITGRSIQIFTEAANNGNLNKYVHLRKDIPSGQYLLRATSASINKTILFTKN